MELGIFDDESIINSRSEHFKISFFDAFVFIEKNVFQSIHISFYPFIWIIGNRFVCETFLLFYTNLTNNTGLIYLDSKWLRPRPLAREGGKSRNHPINWVIFCLIDLNCISSIVQTFSISLLESIRRI
jgi:hypothetical protein